MCVHILSFWLSSTTKRRCNKEFLKITKLALTKLTQFILINENSLLRTRTGDASIYTEDAIIK